MKELIAIIATALFFSACKKNDTESFKDELTTKEKIVIPLQAL